jgi:hypothetical protein
MIGEETIEHFQLNGAVCIRQLFRPEEIDTLRAGIDFSVMTSGTRRAAGRRRRNFPG